MNVTGSATTSTSIYLQWDPPAQNLQNGYIVEYRVRVKETDTGTISITTVTDTSLTLSSLHPYYTYSCSVAAVTVGIGPYSTAINITTDEAGKSGNTYNIILLHNNLSNLQFQVEHHKISQHRPLLHLKQICLGHVPFLMNKMVSLLTMSSI